MIPSAHLFLPYQRRRTLHLRTNLPRRHMLVITYLDVNSLPWFYVLFQARKRAMSRIHPSTFDDPYVVAADL